MQVANFRDYGSRAALDEAFGQRWVYVGQAMPGYGLRGSRLANPYQVAENGRAEAIDLYRQWLWERIRTGDSMIMADLRALDPESVLVCWCKPLICHGDVIMAAWDWLQSQDNELSHNSP